MHSAAPAPNRLASIDAATLLDLCAAAHHRYARCPDDVAPRFAASIVDLELELLRRDVPIDAPREPDVPLRNLNDALRRDTALQRIRRAARHGDVATFRASIFYLSPDDVPEAWHQSYAFRGDLLHLEHALEAVFLTAFAHREGWAAAHAMNEELVESSKTCTSYITVIERRLRDMLRVAAPLEALISSFGRWRQEASD